MKSPTAAVILCGLVLCSSVFAEDPPTKPKELDTLGQYVGHWTSDVTSKPDVWDQNGTKFRTVNQAELILDGWFLQHIEVNHVIGDPDKVTKSLFLWTYDPKSEQFVAWAFQSNGNVATSTGKWDSTIKTFTLAAVEPPPNTTGKMTEQFLDAKTTKGNLTFIDNDGTTLMDMVWTRNRQTESEAKATREEWSKVGRPIQPLPDELKKLQPWIGEWDAEFSIVGPSVGSSTIIRSKGRMTVQWILDGRFMLINMENGKDRFLWMIGYDPAQGKYRRITFTNAGQLGESLGVWNGEFKTIDWKTVNERPGSWKAVNEGPGSAPPHPNDGRYQDHIGIDQVALGQGKEIMQVSILRHDTKGKFYESYGVRSTRRK
jgi:hypothetical protein